MFVYPNLNFPETKLKLEKENGNTKVFDIIRKKYVFLTPEEWVRQHLIHYLINNYKYPKGLIQVERQHRNSGGGKRTDVVVFDRKGLPFLLVECKATIMKFDQDVMLQLTTYNAVIKAKYVAITNGLALLCYKVPQLNSNKIEKLSNFPDFPTAM